MRGVEVASWSVVAIAVLIILYTMCHSNSMMHHQYYEPAPTTASIPALAARAMKAMHLTGETQSEEGDNAEATTPATSKSDDLNAAFTNPSSSSSPSPTEDTNPVANMPMWKKMKASVLSNAREHVKTELSCPTHSAYLGKIGIGSLRPKIKMPEVSAAKKESFEYRTLTDAAHDYYINEKC